MQSHDVLLALATIGYSVAMLGLYLAAGAPAVLIALGVMAILVAGAGLNRNDS